MTTESWFESGAATIECATPPGGAQALLVRPDPSLALDPAPAILWLHWFGHNRNDLTQMLPEAAAMAGHGVVSLLPQGTFPWTRRPTGTPEDVTEVALELERVRAALAHLRAQPGVDPERVAIVGHDYGAMYAMAVRDPDVRLVVAATPDSSWPHWFLKYWPSPSSAAESYRDGFEEFDPLTAAASLGSRLVLQWAEDDDYVPGHTPELFVHAAPDAAVFSYPYDHQLGDAAVVDRLRLLRDALVPPSCEQ